MRHVARFFAFAVAGAVSWSPAALGQEEEPVGRTLLDGGFDQTLLMLGVTRRFQRDSRQAQAHGKRGDR